MTPITILINNRSCIMVTDEGIQSLMENAKKLKYLNPSSCQNVSKQILTQVFTTFFFLFFSFLFFSLFFQIFHLKL